MLSPTLCTIQQVNIICDNIHQFMGKGKRDRQALQDDKVGTLGFFYSNFTAAGDTK